MLQWKTWVEAPKSAKQGYGEPERPYGIVLEEYIKTLMIAEEMV